MIYSASVYKKKLRDFRRSFLFTIYNRYDFFSDIFSQKKKC